MEYRVTIPDEVFGILEWEDEGLPAICVVNQSLANFEPKVVFAWHLSILLEFKENSEIGLPDASEKQVLDDYGDELDRNIKANGNAMFLARITWNNTRQLLYRVYDPEVANTYLISVINESKQKREFDFKMKNDEAWEFAKYFLSYWETGSSKSDN